MLSEEDGYITFSELESESCGRNVWYIRVNTASVVPQPYRQVLLHRGGGDDRLSRVGLFRSHQHALATQQNTHSHRQHRV